MCVKDGLMPYTDENSYIKLEPVEENGYTP